MRLISKTIQPLFNVKDELGIEIVAIWEVELSGFYHDLIKDEVSVRVRFREQGSKFIHSRTFDVNAQGANVSKVHVKNRLLNFLGDNFAEI